MLARLVCAVQQTAGAGAEAVAMPAVASCERAWVLSRGYEIPAAEIAAALRRLTEAANAVTDRPAVAAGLSMPQAGGDFADGVIAHGGAMLGGEMLLSFDEAAVAAWRGLGHRAEVP